MFAMDRLDEIIYNYHSTAPLCPALLCPSTLSPDVANITQHINMYVLYVALNGMAQRTYSCRPRPFLLVPRHHCCTITPGPTESRSKRRAESRQNKTKPTPRTRQNTLLAAACEELERHFERTRQIQQSALAPILLHH